MSETLTSPAAAPSPRPSPTRGEGQEQERVRVDLAALVADGEHAAPFRRPDYRAFLEAKIKMAPLRGVPIAAESVNPALKPHCRAIVPWLVKGGRRALFAAFGLHKTAMQLETLRQILGQFPGEAALIVLPLGVRQEFMREARERFTVADWDKVRG
mgnify:CR=1 FL=1